MKYYLVSDVECVFDDLLLVKFDEDRLLEPCQLLLFLISCNTTKGATQRFSKSL